MSALALLAHRTASESSFLDALPEWLKWTLIFAGWIIGLAFMGVFFGGRR